MTNGNMFGSDARVVISPDHMRAWINLPPPKGQAYTVEGVLEWLPKNNVVFGADAALIKKAVESRIYGELLEVARGKAPVSSVGADYKLRIKPQAFTGLNSNPDGSLQYDELSFLTEVEENEIIAEIFAGSEGKPGKTVTGQDVPFKTEGVNKVLEGSGFIVTDNGKYYRSPCLSHIFFVEKQIVLTPLKKYENITEADGQIDFDGNIFVEKDVHPHSQIKASGSIFIAGRVVSSQIEAGRNILISRGASGMNGFCILNAADNVWSAGLDGCEITAGRDICSTNLSSCEAQCSGRALILGGRGTITATTLKAKSGVISGSIGGTQGNVSIVCGLDSELINNYESIDKNLNKLNLELQALQKNITAIERINRSQMGKPITDPKYKEMVARKAQVLNVCQILEQERIKTKRMIEQFSTVTVIAKVSCQPETTIEINAKSMNIMKKMDKVKFRVNNGLVEAVSMY